MSEFNFGNNPSEFRVYGGFEMVQSVNRRPASVSDFLEDSGKSSFTSAYQTLLARTKISLEGSEDDLLLPAPTSTMAFYQLRGNSVYLGLNELTLKELVSLRTSLHATNNIRSNKDKDNLMTWDKYSFNSSDEAFIPFLKDISGKRDFENIGTIDPSSKPSRYDKESNYDYIDDAFEIIDSRSSLFDRVSRKIGGCMSKEYLRRASSACLLARPFGIKILSSSSFRFHLFKDGRDTLVRRVEVPTINKNESSSLIFDASASVTKPGYPWATNDLESYRYSSRK